MQIIILGMHRSGTSAITRLINMMGAAIGPAQLVAEPAYDNEKGFWELSDIRELNDVLLESLDCNWYDLACFHPERLESACTEEIRERMKRILFRLDVNRPWVMKDPRLCLTFPLWRSLLEVPVCVLPYRAPLEVAWSLKTRNGLDLVHGIALWEFYTLGALNNSAGIPRLMVSYARLMEDPLTVVDDLHAALVSENIHGIRPLSSREVMAFVDKRLVHHKIALDEANDLMNLPQRVLAEAMANGSALLWTEVPHLSQGAAEVLGIYHRLNDLNNKDKMELEQMVGEANSVRGELAAALTNLELITKDASTKDSEIAAAREKLQVLEDALEKAHFDIKQKDVIRQEMNQSLSEFQKVQTATVVQMEKLQSDHDHVTHAIEEQRVELMQTHARLLFLEEALAKSQAEMAEKVTHIHEQDLALVRAQVLLESKEMVAAAQMEKMQSDHDHVTHTADEQRAELIKTHARLLAIQDALDQSQAELTEKITKIHEQDLALIRAEVLITSKEDSLRGLAGEFDALRTRVAQLENGASACQGNVNQRDLTVANFTDAGGGWREIMEKGLQLPEGRTASAHWELRINLPDKETAGGHTHVNEVTCQTCKVHQDALTLIQNASDQFNSLYGLAHQISPEGLEPLGRGISELNAQLQQLQAYCQAKDDQLVFLKRELGLLTTWLEEIDQSFRATLASWRWRLGHGAVSLVERSLLRRQVKLGVDHIRVLLDDYRRWVVQSRDWNSSLNSFQPVQSSTARSAEKVTEIPTAEYPSLLPSVASYDLICLANIDWDARYQRPQQIASQFARQGHRVFYLIASRSLSPDDSKGFQARRVADNIYEVELMANKAIDRYASVIDDENSKLFYQSIERLRDAFSIVDAVCHVHLPFWAPIVFKLRAVWSWPLIYDCMDEWEDFPGIGKPLLAAERTLVKDSDAVTVTAALLEKKYRAHNPRCVLVRNGVDFEFFHLNYQPSNILGDMSHPIIGFYGALAEWVDVGLVAEIAAAQPDWNFVIVGDIFIPNLEGLDKLPNVHLLGRRPYEDMPRYLYHFDVCLIPFRLNQVTHAVDPVKLYEFISAGKPVVAVPLKELAIYSDYIYFAATPEEFVRQIGNALSENDSDSRLRRIQLARDNDWHHRYQITSKLILQLYRRVSIIVVTYKNIDLSRLCIESIIRNTTHPNYEIIVIDNNSRDGTANYLYYMAERHDNIKIIINQENRGFAAANNQGLAMATGDDLVLLNNDTVTPRGWLAPLLKHLCDPKIGLVGPVTNFVGNEAKIDVPYHNLEEMERFAHVFMQTNAGKIFDINVLAMFCVAMRRDVYELIGTLDENFGIGMFEDDDYSNRIKHQGYRVICAEDSFVHHFGQAAFKKLLETGEYHDIWAANQAYFEHKWGKWKPHTPREFS